MRVQKDGVCSGAGRLVGESRSEATPLALKAPVLIGKKRSPFFLPFIIPAFGAQGETLPSPLLCLDQWGRLPVLPDFLQ